MAWRFTDDIGAYAEHAWGLLAASPAEQTVALGVIESVRAGRRWSDDAMLFGWYDDRGEVRGAVSLTPPFELLLAVVPRDAIVELVAALRSARVSLPGVNGRPETVERFVAAWTAATSLRPRVAMRLRLYRLATLRPPAPPPPGMARLADTTDLRIAVGWLREFQREAGVPRTDVEPTARQQIAAGRMWLWESEARSVVSLAARTAAVAGVARIAPVYTPPEHRRRGYGAAVTAACTADATHRGVEHVVLFTDLANPTSNSIYQQLGYRAVGDHCVVRFDR